MSDFDEVLERLLIDPGFKAALAADPATVLAGYQLAPDEIDLLRSRVSADDGGERTVELRSSKASVFGLLAPLGGIGFGHDHAATEIGRSLGPGHPGGPVHPVTGTAAESPHGVVSQHFGPVAGVGDSPAVPATGFGGSAVGDVPAGPSGVAAGDAGLGIIGTPMGPPAPTSGFGVVGHGALGEAAASPSGGSGEAALRAGDLPTGAGHGPTSPADAAESGGTAPGDHPAPAWYHPHIDADGDGKWDKYVAVQHADGSIDIYEDRNHDGIIDFDGHDANHDGVLESADYDTNFDGVADTHMADTNGDGWMDTRGPEPGRG